MDAESMSGEATEVPGYRPVSSLAVAASIVGCVSALALVSPVFWVVPLVGAALAMVAVRDVTSSGVGKAGGLAALAGLALSLGFGSQAVTAAATARWLAASRAESAARFWLDALCDGRTDDARSMCGPDTAAHVDDAAECCAAERARIRCMGTGETPGSWAIVASRGTCQLDLVVEPTNSTTSGPATERWLVTSIVRSPARGGE
ncbi:MAG: hypothetical protein ACKOOF_00230 [Planctomycetaceae bacterium]